VATVAAAPGAGKTVFASLVFEDLRNSGRVDRIGPPPLRQTP
jgi:hypothetical protein